MQIISAMKLWRLLERPPRAGANNENKSAQFGHNGLALVYTSKSASSIEQSMFTIEHDENKSAQFGPNGLALAYKNDDASNLAEFDDFFSQSFPESNGLSNSQDSQNENKSAQFGPNGLALASDCKSASSLEQSISTTESLLSCERTPKARPGSPLDVPSESVPFCDKRRRLLSTPLITGYYVSDRPPVGPSHNNREC